MSLSQNLRYLTNSLGLVPGLSHTLAQAWRLHSKSKVPNRSSDVSGQSGVMRGVLHV